MYSVLDAWNILDSKTGMCAHMSTARLIGHCHCFDLTVLLESNGGFERNCINIGTADRNVSYSPAALVSRCEASEDDRAGDLGSQCGVRVSTSHLQAIKRMVETVLLTSA